MDLCDNCHLIDHACVDHACDFLAFDVHACDLSHRYGASPSQIDDDHVYGHLFCDLYGHAPVYVYDHGHDGYVYSHCYAHVPQTVECSLQDYDSGRDYDLKTSCWYSSC